MIGLKKSQVLGTLGDNRGFLTCSMHVAKKWNKYETIIPYQRYECAAEHVKKGKIHCFLVPGAYPGINDFIMDAGLLAIDTFIEQIPSLVYVEKKGRSENIGVDKLYLHPATDKLSREINTTFCSIDRIYVNSNIEACEFLIENNNSSAITNELCANYFNLHIKKILRASIKMPWVCFSKAHLQ